MSDWSPPQVCMHCKETAVGNLVLWRVKCQHEVIEVKAVGRQVPVKHRPREFTNVYRTSDDVPVSSKVEQHEAQVRARQLQETVKLHDSDVAPSCGFVVGMKRHVTSRAKNVDSSAVPQLLEMLDVFHPLPQLRQRPVWVGLLIQEVSLT